MQSMKLIFPFTAIAVMLALLPAFGFVSELDLWEWVEGRPLPNGWTHGSLEKGNGGAYFNGGSDWLMSPVFDGAIRTVTLEIYTTVPSTEKKLYLFPIANGVTNENGMGVNPTASKVYTIQEFLLTDVDAGANQFVLKFKADGRDCNWWVRRITVCYGDVETDTEDGSSPRHWSLAAFAPKPGYRVADLAALQNARPDTTNPWRNGITVDGFHAFSNEGACTKIGVGNPSSTYSGLYVIVTNDENGPLRALSMLGTSGSAMELMLPIALDTASPVRRLSVDYRVWELANGKSSSLSFSYRTLEDLETMNVKDAVWTSVSNAVWETGDEDVVRTVDLPKKDVRGAEFVCLRWSVPEKASSSIIGISNVRVSAEVGSSGFAVIVK